jgi:hypothetical protein
MALFNLNNLTYANVAINQQGTWTNTNYIYTNLDGVWHPVVNVWQKTNGTWFSLWPTEGVILFLTDVTVTIPPGINFVDICIVGGGGGGGEGQLAGGHNGAGGGGGGGGVVEEFGIPVTAGDQYTITIGAGGAGAAGSGSPGSNHDGSGQPGGSGGNSIVTGPGGTWTAYGGGGGGGFQGSGASLGASTGGGFATFDTPGAGHPVATVAPYQGYAGGYGASNNNVDTGGGGGGAGGAGGQAGYGNPGQGGAGFASTVTGHIIYLGGGGAGALGGLTYGTPSIGGVGGGGGSGQHGTNGTGGGGGGGGAGGGYAISPGGNGGTGCVYVNFYAAAKAPVVAEIDSGTGSVSVPVGSEQLTGGGGGGGGCFTPETLVTLEDGSTLPIYQVSIGQRVMNHDKTKVNTVTFVEVANDKDFGKLYSPDTTNKPFATINHPIYIGGKLSSIDPIQTKEWYPWFDTEKLTPGSVQDGTGKTVYNLWVDGDNTYIVNGYGTTSIIGDGGILRKYVERGDLSAERASVLLFKFTSMGRDIIYGTYFWNNFVGKLDFAPFNNFFIKALRDDSNKTLQSVVFRLFKISGKLINYFR